MIGPLGYGYDVLIDQDDQNCNVISNNLTGSHCKSSRNEFTLDRFQTFEYSRQYVYHWLFKKTQKMCKYDLILLLPFICIIIIIIICIVFLWRPPLKSN